MSNFAYVAKLPDGRTVKGLLEAPSQSEVTAALHQKGLVVVQIKQTVVKTHGRGRVSLDDLAIFSRQMATLVDAGIPIVGGLDAVSESLENKSLREVVIKIRDMVEGGTNLTAAIAKYSSLFTPLFVSLVRAGEVSGHLAEVLDRLATYMEKAAALKRKIRTALVYPTIVFSMAMLITVVLMVWVVPSFKEIFVTLGADLPLPTQVLMWVSDFLQQNLLWAILGMIGLSFGIRRALKNDKVKLWADRIILKLPVAGPLVRKVAIARFSRTLATLIRSGVQILQALEIVSETAGNRVVEEAILEVRTSIREGENIAGPLATSGVFPPMVVRMIAVGEQTGRLDDMLIKIAEFYEDQVDTGVAGLTSAIEPLIIGVLGIVIGSIVFAIFMPIFQISGLV